MNSVILKSAYVCVYACWLMKNLCLNLQKTTFGIEFIIMIVKNEKKINKYQLHLVEY